MTGAILLAFLVYFYLPHVLFKAAAELYVDMGRKQDASQFEEIASAVLPSALLHLLTAMTIAAICLVTPWQFPGVDWPFIASLFGEDAPRQLAAFVAGPQVAWSISYLVCLFCVTAIHGILYGKSRYMKVVGSADRRIYPVTDLNTASRMRRLKLYAVLVSTFFWDLLYGEYYVAIHKWAILKPYVFVKTKEGQLLHGRFLRYDRSRNGEIESITLVQVSRYTREKLVDVLARGANPLSKLEGELYIKWSEVLDINVTTPGKLGELWREYERRKTKPAG